jgi:hypothetical protein
LFLEVREGDERAVDDAPEVGFEEAATVLVGDLVEAAVDGDAGAVDPGVDAAELADGDGGDVLDLLAVGDVALDGDGLAAGGLDGVDDVVEGLLAAGGEHDLGALFGGGLGGGEADAAGGAGDDDDLLVEGFEFDGHGFLSMSLG